MEILEDKVAVRLVRIQRIQKRIVKASEQFPVIGIRAVYKLVYNLANLHITVVDIHWIVAAVVLIVDDLVGTQTKDKCILIADFLNNLHICAVHRTECQRTVEHKLHVAGAARLLRSGRDLFGDICCRKDPLRIGNFVVLDEYHLDAVLDNRIVIYLVCHCIDELDRKLCILVARCCLRTENEGSRIKFHARIFLDLIIEIHHMKNVHELSLVLVQSLDLHVKDGIRVYGHIVVLFDIFCQTHLVLALDLHELFLCHRIIDILHQPFDHRKVYNPVLSYLLSHPVREQRIAVKQETSLCDAVCLVVELLREHLVKVSELLILENLCVKSCHAVYTVSGNDCHVCHLNLTICNDCHLLNLVSRFWISVDNIHQEPAVDLLHDLIDSGKQSLE